VPALERLLWTPAVAGVTRGGKCSDRHLYRCRCLPGARGGLSRRRPSLDRPLSGVSIGTGDRSPDQETARPPDGIAPGDFFRRFLAVCLLRLPLTGVSVPMSKSHAPKSGPETPAPKPKGSANARTRISWTYTAVVWVGLLVLLAGAAYAIFGPGDGSPVLFQAWKVKIDTRNAGLALAAVGALLAAIPLLRRPPDVRLFQAGAQTPRAEGRWREPAAVTLLGIAVLSLVAVVLRGSR
jgi:hypothetical protein